MTEWFESLVCTTEAVLILVDPAGNSAKQAIEATPVNKAEWLAN
jgi:hypothetical protein